MLLENHREFQRVNYYKQPLTSSRLKQLLRKMGMHARDLLRENEPIYKHLDLAKKKDQLSESELIDLMIQHPDLIQRPIVEKGDKAVLGRPTEKIEELLRD